MLIIKYSLSQPDSIFSAIMSDSKPTCPNCGSKHTVKNGRIHNKKSKYQCQDCGRQFVENSTKKVISQETKDLIDRLLLEKIPLAGIAPCNWCIGAMVAKVRQYQIR